MKICSQCKKEKPFSEFYHDKWSRDGRIAECKHCSLARNRKAVRTKVGCISKIYATQICHSKHRGHQPPEYTKDQLTKWLYLNGFFYSKSLRRVS